MNILEKTYLLWISISFLLFYVASLLHLIKRHRLTLNKAIDAGEEILETSYFWQKKHSNAQNELTYLKDVNIQLNKQRDSNAAMYLEEKKARLNIIEDYKKLLDNRDDLNNRLVCSQSVQKNAFACIEKQDKKIAFLKEKNTNLNELLSKIDLALDISQYKLLKNKTNEKST